MAYSSLYKIFVIHEDSANSRGSTLTTVAIMNGCYRPSVLYTTLSRRFLNLFNHSLELYTCVNVANKHIQYIFDICRCKDFIFDSKCQKRQCHVRFKKNVIRKGIIHERTETPPFFKWQWFELPNFAVYSPWYCNFGLLNRPI